MKTHPKEVIKYCPRCGCARFNTVNNGRSFNCEDCGFDFYINNSAAIACLIFDENGRLLLCRRAKEPSRGMLDLPGGFVEPEESAEEAICREIREELNIDVISSEYLVSFPNEYVFSGYSVFTLDLAYICRVSSFEWIIPGDDISAAEFYYPGEIKLSELYSESMRRIINFYLLEYSE